MTNGPNTEKRRCLGRPAQRRVNEIVGTLMDDGTMDRIFGNYGITYRNPLVR